MNRLSQTMPMPTIMPTEKAQAARPNTSANSNTPALPVSNCRVVLRPPFELAPARWDPDIRPPRRAALPIHPAIGRGGRWSPPLLMRSVPIELARIADDALGADHALDEMRDHGGRVVLVKPSVAVSTFGEAGAHECR